MGDAANAAAAPTDQAAQPDRNALHNAFGAVETWIFDLDNTLYPSECRLFDQIDRKMTGFISEALALEPAEANALRKRYWMEHGTTLNGLMQEHGLGAEAFLDYVHDIDLAAVAPAPALRAAIEALPGRKFVHTNGSRGHAERVTRHLGLERCFDALFGIEDSELTPKPRRLAYERVAARAGLDPQRSAMFVDTARNLIEPHRMGMRTIWTPTDCDHAGQGAEGPHVHFTAPDLPDFIARLADALRPA